MKLPDNAVIQNSSTPVLNRLRELDFLRGMAIVLVLLRHQYLFSFTQKMGWIGVDLFFVLSGFLVSGLLFKEYLKFGDIKPKRFLIRRGFKIYPIYYIFYLLYILPLVIKGNADFFGFLSDMVFVQNYYSGWGYAYGPGWSLAIEEHFYFSFSLILWLGLVYNKITLKLHTEKTIGNSSFETGILLIMLTCLALRLFSNLTFPDMDDKNFTMTHLRIDSLSTGVLVSYLYYFKNNFLNTLFQKYKYLFYVIAIAGLSWTPFINPIPSFFVRTFGFSLLYISFGILLIYFLVTPDINKKLNRVFSNHVVNIISKIGYCSYSIYIIHIFVNRVYKVTVSKLDLYHNSYTNFIITSTLSVVIGMIMTYKIEKYFLKIRDKYYPSRV